jgi:hypothetical protein
MRRLIVSACVLLAACGGDSPTAPAPIAVLIRSVTPQLEPRGVVVAVENTGGNGSFRVTLRDVNGVQRCQSGGALINAGVRTTGTYPCAVTVAYVTVEVQDGAAPAWRRSACAAVDASQQGNCAALP